MNSQTLRDARKFEEIMEQKITAEERPMFHLSSRVGWMNDPNGFAWYNGMYHMFYQYHPYDSCWGPMHWGHAVSKDLLHWEYLPTAIAPDTEYDCDGCFSGGSVELDDGRHLLVYTGVHRKLQENGEMRDIQTQCIAVGDGVDYEKYWGNPVVDEKKLPEGSSKFDFRDPKVWKENGKYYFVAVNNREDEKGGRILLYSSKDGFEWEFESILIENNGDFGRMWECPDFFELDGKWVVLTSPQDMLPKDFEYHNGDGTLCLLGEYDKEAKKFIAESDHTIDYGIDFYASQTLETPDGRRIMTGWMQNWDTCNNTRQPKRKWQGQLCTPRELSIKNGRMYQNPIRELEEYRKNKVSYQDMMLQGDVKLEGIKGRVVDMEIEIEAGNPEDIYKKFEVHFAENEEYHTRL